MEIRVKFRKNESVNVQCKLKLEKVGREMGVEIRKCGCKNGCGNGN